MRKASDIERRLDSLGASATDSLRHLTEALLSLFSGGSSLQLPERLDSLGASAADSLRHLTEALLSLFSGGSSFQLPERF